MYLKQLRPALTLLLLLTVLLGGIYPLAITAVGKLAFPRQAAGSLLIEQGKLVGSLLIGQNFTDPKYFWGRPSATSPTPYSALASGGSNLGPLNPALVERVRASVKALRDADPGNLEPVPVDQVTTSASGLDPHISPDAARYQIRRIALARHLPVAELALLIAEHQQGRLLGLIGEPRVNVLQLNLALDALHSREPSMH